MFFGARLNGIRFQEPELESLWWNFWLIKMHMALTDCSLMTLSQLSVSGKLTELHLLYAFVGKTAE